ncbi:hypothetical protein MRX96_014310 [Rhipicephalus microplus]
MTRNRLASTLPQPTSLGREPTLHPKIATLKHRTVPTTSSIIRRRTESAICEQPVKAPQIKPLVADEQATPALPPLIQHR